MKNKINRINSLIKKNEHLVNFTALVVAIAALVIAFIALNTIATVYSIPKDVVGFCPSVIGIGGSCNFGTNTCGEKSETFNYSCYGNNSDYVQIISNIYNKGSALATNIHMEIQLENNTLFTSPNYRTLALNLAELYQNGAVSKELPVCENNCEIVTDTIPILKPSDTFEFRATFNRNDFKENPKYVKFILYQDGEEKIEKFIDISYKP